jgi:hypothetical protein
MKTICPGCGATLTNEAGERLRSGNFTGNLPRPTEDTTYAWCDECVKNPPVNGERYVRMLVLFSRADSKGMLEKLATMYVFDENYASADITRALRAVEIEKGWHA